MPKSSPATPATGTSLQHLEPVVVLPSTLCDMQCSSETLISLTAICTGLMAETLSQDMMFLALSRAARDAEKAGVKTAEFNRIRDIVIRHWTSQMARNPLSRMF